MTASDYAREQLRGMMSQLGVGVVELAKRTGKDKSQISRILNSDSSLQINTIDELFQGMGVIMGFQLIVNPDVLFDDEDDPALD